MERIHFTVNINAPKEKVWDVLWTKGNYEAWTAAFAEGSTAITDWQQGSKVLFVDGATGNGMVSRIEEKRDNEYMSFTHLGEIKDGVEDTTSEKVKAWNGAKENYTLTENNHVTTLDVEQDISAEYKDYFLTTWPKAMQAIKTMAEQND